MKDEVRLVPVLGDDIDGLMPLVEAYYAVDGHHFDYPAVSRGARELLAHPDWGSLRFIEHRGVVIGYLILTYSFSLEFHGKDGLVDEIFIEESSRSQGLGSRALELACEEARSHGARALHLEVRRDNHPAHRSYERVGFEKREDFFLMSRRLSERDREH